MFIRRLMIISNSIRKSIPKEHRYIDNHYVIECENEKVVVCTRHPQSDSLVLSTETILGKGGPQYVNRVSYKIDKTQIKLNPAPETNYYENKNMTSIVKTREYAASFSVVDLSNITLEK